MLLEIFNLTWKLQSRLNFSISTFWIPHKKQKGLHGWLTWNLQFRLQNSIPGRSWIFSIFGPLPRISQKGSPKRCHFRFVFFFFRFLPFVPFFSLLSFSFSSVLFRFLPFASVSFSEDKKKKIPFARPFRETPTYPKNLLRLLFRNGLTRGFVSKDILFPSTFKKNFPRQPCETSWCLAGQKLTPRCVAATFDSQLPSRWSSHQVILNKLPKP